MVKRGFYNGNKTFAFAIVFLMIFIVFCVVFSSAVEKNGKVDIKVKKVIDKDKKVDVIVSYNEVGAKNIKNDTNIEKREVNAKELKDLENNVDVKKVEYDYPIKAMLQDSVVVISASGTWAVKIGSVNLTGLGEGICILDTGVDYTHPDLGGCFGNGCKVIGGYDYVNNDGNPLDDNGHGTHVAGIAAANGSISGVAKDANIIAIKVLDASGNGATSSLINGINWCVNNASIYNISVISMSLGTSELFSSNCDGSFTTLSAAINNAVAKNITVVAASGNSGNGIVRSTTSIASPACITNVTAIAATNKDDSIASYSHYSSLVSLFAPGTLINSTLRGGGHVLDSGTSMATPHAAGAYALAKQLLRIENRTKTPAELTDIFRGMGDIISEDYIRINVYDTINYLSYESINLTYPSDGSSFNTNVTFRCNITAYTNVSNVTFYLMNSSGEIIRNVTTNLTGMNNGSTFTSNFTYEDDYLWNCRFGFESSIHAWADSDYNVRYDLTRPVLTVNSPLNNSWYNGGRFNVTLNENGTCLYNFNNTNYSMAGEISFYGNRTLTEGVYNITYYCNDSAGNLNNSQMYFFNVELTAPNVSAVSPADGFSTTDTGGVFQYTTDDNINLSSCSLIVDNVRVKDNLSEITNLTNTISYTLAVGSHNWNINCTDVSGNSNITSARTITITAVEVVNNNVGGGGGGGGGMIKTASVTGAVYTPTLQEVSSGYSGSFRKTDSVVFSLMNGKHNLTISEVQNKSVTLIIRSDPIVLKMNEGEERKINISSSNYYDLYIKIDKINYTNVSMTIKNIYEKIFIEKNNESEIVFHTQENTKDGKKYYTLYWIVGGMSFIVLVIIIYSYIKYKMHKKSVKRRK